MADSSPMGRNHSWKRRNCSLTVFWKDLYCRHVKTRACLGKGYLKEGFCQCFEKINDKKINDKKEESPYNQYFVYFFHSDFNPFNKKPHSIIHCCFLHRFAMSRRLFVFGNKLPHFRQVYALYPLTLYHTIPTFNNKKKDLENTVRKGENAGNQHFLLFPQCFLLYQREKLSF